MPQILNTFGTVSYNKTGVIKPECMFPFSLSESGFSLMKLQKSNYRSSELLGLFWTLPIVLYVEDKKSHNVSETGSVSVLRWMGQDKPTQLGPLWDFLSSTYKTMDSVQNKPNSSVQHTPSSESFQVYLQIISWFKSVYEGGYYQTRSQL
jgi:hypothetical protein